MSQHLRGPTPCQAVIICCEHIWPLEGDVASKSICQIYQNADTFLFLPLKYSPFILRSLFTKINIHMLSYLLIWLVDHYVHCIWASNDAQEGRRRPAKSSLMYWLKKMFCLYLIQMEVDWVDNIWMDSSNIWLHDGTLNNFFCSGSRNLFWS